MLFNNTYILFYCLPDIMIEKYLILILALSLLITPGFAFAETEEIKFFDNRFLLNDKKTPTVCVHEPENYNNGWENNDLFLFTEYSVKKWEARLNQFTEDDSFNINFLIIDNATGFGKPTIMFRECDININFMGAPLLNIDTGGYLKGGTYHHSGDRVWMDIVIWTWDYFLQDPREKFGDEYVDDLIKEYNATSYTKHFAAEKTSQSSMIATLDHELGHTFGLKHHTWNGEYNMMYYNTTHAEKSIMYTVTDRNDTIKDIRLVDIYALLAKYGTDGWAGYTNWEITELRITN